MELLVFPSDRHYVKAQRRAVRRKSDNPSFTDREMRSIARHQTDILARQSSLVDEVRGMCHGARGGLEALTLAGELIWETDIQSTDLFPESDKVMEWDFSKQKESWEDYFHFLYSNSLDHARHPIETLRIWFNQLVKSGVGRLYIQWTTCHKGVHGGDCFGASLDEYISLIDEAGEVDDLLYCGDGLTVIVAKRRD